MDDIGKKLRQEFDGAQPIKFNGADDPAPFYPLIGIAELCAMAPQEYLIEGLIPKNGLSLIYGSPGTCKSFFARDIALNVSVSAKVIYIAGEGIGGMGNRCQAWLTHNTQDADKVDFSVIRDSVIFLEPTDRTKLLATLNAVEHPPALIVVDTLARSYGGDENSATDMSSFIRTCDALREATGAAVLIVHHTPKEAGRGPRGSTALLGAVDTAFEIKKENRAITVSCTKMKDDEAPQQKGFELTIVELESETSCVLVPTESMPGQREKSLTPREQKSLTVLQSLIAKEGSKQKPRADMPVVSAVGLDSFRERLKSVGVTNRDEPDSERSQWSAIRSGLVSKDAIAVWENVVWLSS